MGFRVQVGKFVVECDTAADVIALASGSIIGVSGGDVVGNGVVANGRKKRGPKKGKPNVALKKVWAAARRLAKKEGITVFEARKKLAKAK